MRCGVDPRRSLDPSLLWLWHRPVATAPIRPLTWEPPYASGAALERKQKDKKKRKKKDIQYVLKGKNVQMHDSISIVLKPNCSEHLQAFSNPCGSINWSCKTLSSHVVQLVQDLALPQLCAGHNCSMDSIPGPPFQCYGCSTPSKNTWPD